MNVTVCFSIKHSGSEDLKLARGFLSILLNLVNKFVRKDITHQQFCNETKEICEKIYNHPPRFLCCAPIPDSIAKAKELYFKICFAWTVILLTATIHHSNEYLKCWAEQALQDLKTAPEGFEIFELVFLLKFITAVIGSYKEIKDQNVPEIKNQIQNILTECAKIYEKCRLPSFSPIPFDLLEPNITFCTLYSAQTNYFKGFQSILSPKRVLDHLHLELNEVYINYLETFAPDQVKKLLISQVFLAKYKFEYGIDFDFEKFIMFCCHAVHSFFEQKNYSQAFYLLQASKAVLEKMKAVVNDSNSMRCCEFWVKYQFFMYYSAYVSVSLKASISDISKTWMFKEFYIRFNGLKLNEQRGDELFYRLAANKNEISFAVKKLEAAIQDLEKLVLDNNQSVIGERQRNQLIQLLHETEKNLKVFSKKQA